jgi:putative heme-binding domain-containing protein
MCQVRRFVGVPIFGASRGASCFIPIMLVWFPLALQARDESPTKVEPGSDPRLPIREGLVVWLDASRLEETRESARAGELQNGAPIAVWPDASGHKRDLVQKQAEHRPIYQKTGDFRSVRFNGQGKYLRASGLGQSFRDATVYVVAAPYSCPEYFSAFLSMSASARNDFETGLNLDQAVGSPQRFEVVNIEGAGSAGLQNLLKDPAPYGTVSRLCVTTTPGKAGTTLWLDGKKQGSRDRRESTVVRMDELIVGARYFTLGGSPEPRAFFEGDIAEVLVFDRVLTDKERTAVDRYLTTKYGTVAPLPVPVSTAGGKALAPVQNPPPVQIFLPGFTVRELPIDLSNINNLLYRPDGKLLALGYDGNVWLLSDTNGDGLEDTAVLWWENKGRLRAPIGMALTPPGYPKGNGVFVPCKGKLSLIVDTDGDDRADKEIVVAEGWHELLHGVDALGVALDRDGSVYFGLGCTNYTQAYLIDKDGKSHYDLKSERGTILRVSPDFKSREIVATGIRFPVCMRFNSAGDLFCTDQEGATWLPNGNPLDELLHIQKGRHYGFPPRHPKYLPGVIDEPSTFDYGPQHQSTCGFCFNDPIKPGGPTFGPPSWSGDVFVAGYGRGKLFRTQLEKTASGYVARNHLFACTSMLPVDCCLTPDGSLLIACHGGGPEWGSGPTGKGKIFKISYTDKEHPQPALIWPAGPRELRIEFDRPVDPQLLRDVLAKTEITAGRFVRAGDRFESLWPGYATVQAQKRSPRFDVHVHSAQLTADRRTLVLATDQLEAAVHYAITLPGMGRPVKSESRETGLPQVPAIDLDFDLSGVMATLSKNGTLTWTGWLPSLDLALSRRWTNGSAHHDQLWKATAKLEGELALRTQLDVTDMLRPAVQPGSKLDYQWPPEQVSVSYQSPQTVTIDGPTLGAIRERLIEFKKQTDQPVPVEFKLTSTSPNSAAALQLAFTTNEDARPRPLPLRRMMLPWSSSKTDMSKTVELPRPAELEGGSWARGRRIFHAEQPGCVKCHAVQGQGGEIGPDLGSLTHRDYASVLRDITQPSFAINPDYAASVLILKDGRTLTGVMRTRGDQLHIGNKDGKTTVIQKTDVEEIQPSRVSIMPEDLLKPLDASTKRDLLTYLLSPDTSMPHDSPGQRPPPRSVAEVNRILGGAPVPPEKTRPLRVVLVAGPKDHGPGEHDYPAWLRVWGELLSADDKLEIVKAMNWPSADEFHKADVIVFYQRGDWDKRRSADIDAFLARGGGLVYIHFAVDGQKDATGFAKRIGLAWGNGARFRHGPVDLEFEKSSGHPILRNFDKLKLIDESYWNLTGTMPKSNTLGWGVEDKKPQPLFWSLEHGKGRVFVSIPGHFSWTFDDPLFRILLLRGIAWTAHEPVDRFNELVWPGADVAK